MSSQAVAVGDVRAGCAACGSVLIIEKAGVVRMAEPPPGPEPAPQLIVPPTIEPPLQTTAMGEYALADETLEARSDDRALTGSFYVAHSPPRGAHDIDAFVAEQVRAYVNDGRVSYAAPAPETRPQSVVLPPQAESPAAPPPATPPPAIPSLAIPPPATPPPAIPSLAIPSLAIPSPATPPPAIPSLAIPPVAPPSAGFALPEVSNIMAAPPQIEPTDSVDTGPISIPIAVPRFAPTQVAPPLRPPPGPVSAAAPPLRMKAPPSPPPIPDSVASAEEDASYLETWKEPERQEPLEIFGIAEPPPVNPHPPALMFHTSHHVHAMAGPARETVQTPVLLTEPSQPHKLVAEIPEWTGQSLEDETGLVPPPHTMADDTAAAGYSASDGYVAPTPPQGFDSDFFSESPTFESDESTRPPTSTPLHAQPSEYASAYNEQPRHARADGQYGEAGGYFEATPDHDGQATSHAAANFYESAYSQAPSHEQALGYGEAPGHQPPGYDQLLDHTAGDDPPRGYGQTPGYGHAAGDAQPQGHGQTPGYDQPQGYGHAASDAQPQGHGQTPGYDQPQGYGHAAGDAQPQAYGQTPGYDQPQGYGHAAGDAQPQGYGQTLGYDQPHGYGNAAGDHQPQGYDEALVHARAPGYDQSSYGQTPHAYSGADYAAGYDPAPAYNQAPMPDDAPVYEASAALAPMAHEVDPFGVSSSPPATAKPTVIDRNAQAANDDDDFALPRRRKWPWVAAACLLSAAGLGGYLFGNAGDEVASPTPSPAVAIEPVVAPPSPPEQPIPDGQVALASAGDVHSTTGIETVHAEPPPAPPGDETPTSTATSSPVQPSAAQALPRQMPPIGSAPLADIPPTIPVSSAIAATPPAVPSTATTGLRAVPGEATAAVEPSPITEPQLQAQAGAGILRDVQLCYTRGNRLLNQKKVGLAIRELNKCRDIDPSYGRVYRSLGVAYMLLGRERSAILAYEKFVDIEPQHKDVAKVREIIADYYRRKKP